MFIHLVVLCHREFRYQSQKHLDRIKKYPKAFSNTKIPEKYFIFKKLFIYLAVFNLS